MRRTLFLLLLVAGCKSKIDPAKCKARMDVVEAQVAHELRLGDVLEDIDSRVHDARATLPVVKDADPTPLEPGFVIWADSDPDAFAMAIAEEACRTTSRNIYLLADASIPAETLSERAAWLAAAAKAWGVELRVRQVVSLPAAREYTPWPAGTTEAVKKWASDAVAGDDVEAKANKIRARLLETEKGCDAIQKRTEEASESGGDDLHLAWVRGLRDCNCSVHDLDETIAVHHVLELTHADLAQAVIAPGTTTRPVPPLHCGDRKPFVLRERQAWRTRPPELDPAIDELGARLVDCAERAPQERGEQYELVITPSSLMDGKQLDVDSHRLGPYGHRNDLEECMHRAPFELAAPAEGEMHAEVYVPAMPRKPSSQRR